MERAGQGPPEYFLVVVLSLVCQQRFVVATAAAARRRCGMHTEPGCKTESWQRRASHLTAQRSDRPARQSIHKYLRQCPSPTTGRKPRRKDRRHGNGYGGQFRRVAHASSPVGNQSRACCSSWSIWRKGDDSAAVRYPRHSRRGALSRAQPAAFYASQNQGRAYRSQGAGAQ
jgi:hypothetical protein